MARQSISIISSKQNSMHRRSLLSVLLILALMPAGSLSASCDCCCLTVAPAALINAQSLERAAHHTGIAAQHHHHGSAMVSVVAAAQAARVAMKYEQRFSGHTCCRDARASISTSYVTPPESGLQQRRLGQKGSDNSEVVPRHPAFRLIEQDWNRRLSPDDEHSAVCSPLPILRI